MSTINFQPNPFMFPLPPIPPVNINNFKEIQELGSGQHGSVVKVICSLNNQTFALKKILQSYFINPNTNQLDDEKEKDYYRETYILNYLNQKTMQYNPGVLRLYYNFQDKQYRYIVTDFVQGKSLKKLREEHQEKNLYIEQKHIITIFRGLLNILIFLHDNCHIIHRDIKPENIIVDESYNVKLLDFGLAVYYQSPYPNQMIDNRLITRCSFKGTRKYVPPEILYSKYRNYDYKVDIFCLGFTMYNIMNPNDINNNTNLPQDTDKNNQRINMKNTNKFYDDWLMNLIKTLYSPDPSLRPTAQFALALLNQNISNPRRINPCITINENIIKSFSTGLINLQNQLTQFNINDAGFDMNTNKNFVKLPSEIIMYEQNIFLKPNQGYENKIISSMKCLLHILFSLPCIEELCGLLQSLYTNRPQKTFMESFNNIFKDYKYMKQNIISKIDYEMKINAFISEVFKRNLDDKSGPRPAILFYMISSIIKDEFLNLCPTYKNKIFGEEIDMNNYPFDFILPRQNYNQLCDKLIKQINNFKLKNKSPFVDNFYLLVMTRDKCPQCPRVFNVEAYYGLFLQLKIGKNEEKLEDLLKSFFADTFLPSAYQCSGCNSSELLTQQNICLNAPNYLLLELEDRNKVIFREIIDITLYNEDKIVYEFFGAIYKQRYETYSEFFAITKQGKNLIRYDKDTFTEINDFNMVNSPKPSLAFYKKIQ